MSVGMTVTPALAEEATPEAAAPAETVAVNAPTFYANSHDVKAVVMNIGAAQDSVNVTWYGSTPTGGMLKYGVQGGEMTTLQAAVAPTSSEGWYKNTVTLTGLQSNTTYEYAVSADKDEAHYGETKTYTTQTFGKDEPYTFLVFGDPQIGCSGSIDDDNGGWTNTLNHALAKAPNANFLFSMGDQINAYYKYDTSNLSQVEEEYDGFLNAPQLTQLPLATELGNHDCGYNTALYGQHFTLPNISEKYGQVSGDAYGDNAVDSESTGDGDYYFTYNNTLYMVLNTSCLSIAEHKAFLEETIQANPDVTWKVVSFHKSIYSVASHVTESDIVTLRNGLSPILSQLGIDIVLQGHDHVYARSYIMGGESGMTADVQKNADGSALTEVTNPDGVQYITMNSASGSKFYKITEEAFEYTAVQNQEKVPNYSVANVTKDAFTVTTYRSTDDSVVDTITIKKSKNGWETVDGKDYWYEDGVKQGTEGRGKEIYDPESDAWYWLDSDANGAKAVSKDVYQESDGGKWVRYDANGHMIKGWNTNSQGTYYFDLITGAMAKGTVVIDGITCVFDYNTGILQSTNVDVTKYREIKRTNYYADGSVMNTLTTDYDAQGRLLKEQRRDKSGNLQVQDDFYYEYNGMLTKHTHREYGNDNYSYEYRYEYDNSNRFAKISVYRYNGGWYLYSYWTAKEWDSLGSVSKFWEYNGQNKVTCIVNLTSSGSRNRYTKMTIVNSSNKTVRTDTWSYDSNGHLAGWTNSGNSNGYSNVLRLSSDNNIGAGNPLFDRHCGKFVTDDKITSASIKFQNDEVVEIRQNNQRISYTNQESMGMNSSNNLTRTFATYTDGGNFRYRTLVEYFKYKN
mgnify:FL=1